MSIQHVLFLTPGFPTNEMETNCLPAVQQFLLAYKRRFPQLKVSIISLHYPFNRSLYQWHGIDIHALNAKSGNWFYTVIAVMKAYRFANSINEKSKVNAVVSFWLTDAALAANLIAKKFQCPYLFWMHGQDAKKGNKFYKLIRPSSKNLAAISDYQADVFFKANGQNVGHIIHNGVNDYSFPALNTGKRTIDLLAVGSFIPLKQYSLFIDLVKYLVENGCPDINAMLVGDGVLEQELRTLVEKYNLQKNIAFTGRLQQYQVLEYMNNARFFIHPSNYEGHSTVILEALYSGCTVLSFIPVAAQQPRNFILCKDFNAMKITMKELISKELEPTRIKLNDMTDSAVQLHSILNSML